MDELVRHTKGRIEIYQKQLENAKTAYDQQKALIDHLERQLQDIGAERDQFQAELEAEAQKQGLQLNSEQVEKIKQAHTL